MSSHDTYGFANVDGFLDPMIGNTSAIGLGNPFWSKSGLGEGDHSVVISRGFNNESSPFSLDYFEITYEDDMRASSLAPGSIDAPSELVNIVDDNDERITYTGSWIPYYTRQIVFYFGGSTKNSNDTNSSVSFSFNGTSIWYFCDKDRTNAKVLIKVDNGEGEVVNTALPYADKRWFSQALCWSKTDLPDGPHTVTIAHHDDPGRWLCLDFLAYASIPTASHKSKVPPGAIAGGAVGGGVGLILIFAVVYWLYRRRKAPIETNSKANDTETSTEHKGTESPPGSLTVAGLSYRSEQWSPGMVVANSNTNKAPTGGNQWSTQQYPRLPEPHTE